MICVLEFSANSVWLVRRFLYLLGSGDWRPRYTPLVLGRANVPHTLDRVKPGSAQWVKPGLTVRVLPYRAGSGFIHNLCTYRTNVTFVTASSHLLHHPETSGTQEIKRPKGRSVPPPTGSALGNECWLQNRR